MNISFHNIISKYADLFKKTKFVQNVYIKVNINSETGEKKDIISFYNDVFIVKMKIYIISLKPSLYNNP